MGKSSKAPAAPDPYKTAQAESQFNRFDEYRPNGGGIRYGFTNGAGQFQQGVAPQGMQSAVQALESPTEGAIRSSLEGQALTNLGTLGAAPRPPGPGNFALTPAASMPSDLNLPPEARFSTMGLPGVPNAPGRTGLPARASADPNDIPAVERALFNRSLSLVQPEIDRGRSNLQSDLQARGMPVGSAGWNEAVGGMERGYGEQMDRLAQSAILAGGQEQSRRYGLQADARERARGEQDQDYALSRDSSDANWNRALTVNDMRARERATAMGEQDRTFNLQNLVRSQAINEGVDFYNLNRGARDAQLAELASLMGGAYSPVGPATRIGGGSPVNYGGMVQQQYANQLQQSQARQQQGVGTISALGNLGMAGYMLLSSRAWKERRGDIDPVEMLRAVMSLPLHRWRYTEASEIGELAPVDHIGPFAEDWQTATGYGDGRHISTIDAIGVLIAAVQALAREIAVLKGPHEAFTTREAF